MLNRASHRLEGRMNLLEIFQETARTGGWRFQRRTGSIDVPIPNAERRFTAGREVDGVSVESNAQAWQYESPTSSQHWLPDRYPSHPGIGSSDTARVLGRYAVERHVVPGKQERRLFSRVLRRDRQHCGGGYAAGGRLASPDTCGPSSCARTQRVIAATLISGNRLSSSSSCLSQDTIRFEFAPVWSTNLRAPIHAKGAHRSAQRDP